MTTSVVCSTLVASTSDCGARSGMAPAEDIVFDCPAPFAKNVQAFALADDEVVAAVYPAVVALRKADAQKRVIAEGTFASAVVTNGVDVAWIAACGVERAALLGHVAVDQLPCTIGASTPTGLAFGPDGVLLHAADTRGSSFAPPPSKRVDLVGPIAANAHAIIGVSRETPSSFILLDESATHRRVLLADTVAHDHRDAALALADHVACVVTGRPERFGEEHRAWYPAVRCAELAREGPACTVTTFPGGTMTTLALEGDSLFVATTSVTTDELSVDEYNVAGVERARSTLRCRMNAGGRRADIAADARWVWVRAPNGELFRIPRR